MSSLFIKSAHRYRSKYWWKIGCIALIGLGGYLLFAPLLPVLSPGVYHKIDPTKPLFAGTPQEKISTVNTLLIPTIGVDAPVLEGKDAGTLNRGLWHIPTSSTPDQGTNTVITGHRFQYLTGPHTFYNLDKVKLGDPIVLDWNGKRYAYKVTVIKTVLPSELSVEQPTAHPTLTIYTCTPLWTETHRLVVQAVLVPA